MNHEILLGPRTYKETIDPCVVERFHVSPPVVVVHRLNHDLFSPKLPASRMRTMLSHNATANAFIGLARAAKRPRVYLVGHLWSGNSE